MRKAIFSYSQTPLALLPRKHRHLSARTLPVQETPSRRDVDWFHTYPVLFWRCYLLSSGSLNGLVTECISFTSNYTEYQTKPINCDQVRIARVRRNLSEVSALIWFLTYRLFRIS